MADHGYDVRRSPAMRRNSIAFGAFQADCRRAGLRATVGLSGTGIAGEKDPPHDLVIHVRSERPGRPLNLAERVTDSMRDTIMLLRRQIGMVAQ